MAILREHIPYYKEIFELPGFFSDPAMVFGFQDIQVKLDHFTPWSRLPLRGRSKKLIRALRWRRRALFGKIHPDLEVPEEFRARDIVELLRNRGLKDVSVIDLFDPRADKRYDMNQPVPAFEHERYGLLIDIGSLEHVFDTRQCVENLLRMVRPEGVYMLLTPVNGFFGHGLHVFNPEALTKALTLNGFEILLHRYSTQSGVPLEHPSQAPDTLVWLVARKREPLGRFVVPQQGTWETMYPRVDEP